MNKKIDVFYLVVKSQRAWISLNPSSSVCCVSCRSFMYWKRLSLTSLPSRELATVLVRHELRHRFTECQPIRNIHVKMHGARHNKHWPTQYMRIGAMCAPLIAKTGEWISSIENVTNDCALANFSRCTTPNCISEDQLTCNWQSRAHKCKLNITVPSTDTEFPNSIYLMK